MNPQAWQKESKYFGFQGHQIFYKFEGSGPILVLLHGFPTSSYDWHKIHEGLCEDFRVLCFDMLGYGFSDKPQDYPYSIFKQADIVEALLIHLGISECHILAHDKGDTVANELLARLQENKFKTKILSLCMLNGGLFPGIHKPRPVQWALMTPFGKYISRLYNFGMFKKTFSKIFGPDTQASEEELDDLWQLMNYKDGMKVFHLLIRYMQDRIDNKERWLKALQETDVPLRLIIGEFDPISGAHMGDHYEKVIPNADLVRLKNIGHYPQLEAPNEVLSHFHSFVRKHLV